MYDVSEAYKTESRQIVRNQSGIKVALKVTNPDAPDASTLIDTGHMYWSDLDNVIYRDVREVPTYGTLEHNFFALDGTQELAPDMRENYQGYVSDVVSGADGTFENNPIIRIDFDEYFSFVGLTYTFDSSRGGYPAEMRVRAYNDGALMFDVAYTDVDSYEYSSGDRIPSGADNFINAIEIEFTKTYVPYRRIRLESLQYGAILRYSNTEVQQATWSREIDLISTSLPTETLSFSVIDDKRNYDPDEAQGIYAYLQDRQQISFRMGYELNSETMEWLDAGELYTTGEFTIDGASSIPIMTVAAQSTLLALTEVYSQGKYYDSGRSLGNLLRDLVSSCTQLHPSLIYDSSLDSMITKMPLPKAEVRNNLQLIANAAMCSLWTDRDGVIHVESLEDTPDSGFAFTYDDTYTAPETTKYPVYIRYLRHTQMW